jgi:hypothetical protein
MLVTSVFWKEDCCELRPALATQQGPLPKKKKKIVRKGKLKTFPGSNQESHRIVMWELSG